MLLGNHKMSSIFSYFYTILIVTSPIISYYMLSIGNGLYSCVDIALLLFILCYLLKNKKYALKTYDLYYLSFTIFLICVSYLMLIIWDIDIKFYNLFSVFVRPIIFVFIICVFSKKIFRYRYAIKLYSNVAVIVSILLIIQYFSFLLLHYYPNFYIPGFRLMYASAANPEGTLWVEELIQLQAYARCSMFRPSSVFMEPSYFSYYVIPCIALLLSKKLNFNNILKLIFMITAVLCSTSLSGYILLAILIIEFILERPHYLIIYIALIIFICCLLWIWNPSAILFTLERIGRLNLTINLDETDISMFHRVLCGWLTWLDLPWFNKLLGCGMYIQQVLSTTDNIWFLRMGSTYMNTFSWVLCTTGIGGMICFILFFINLYKAIQSTVATNLLLVLIVILNYEYYYSFYQWPLIFSLIISSTMKVSQCMCDKDRYCKSCLNSRGSM